MFFASFDLVKLIVVYFFSVSLLDSSQGLLKAVPEKNGSPHCAPKKKSADGRNFGTSEAQKESKKMSQHSVQDETKKNGDDDDDDDDDDQLETFVVQTA